MAKLTKQQRQDRKDLTYGKINGAKVAMQKSGGETETVTGDAPGMVYYGAAAPKNIVYKTMSVGYGSDPGSQDTEYISTSNPNYMTKKKLMSTYGWSAKKVQKERTRAKKAVEYSYDEDNEKYRPW